VGELLGVFVADAVGVAVAVDDAVAVTVGAGAPPVTMRGQQNWSVVE